MDFIIKKVDGIGYLPIVLDEYSNEIYRGEHHQKAHDAIDAALSYVDEHYCGDCNMPVDHKDFTWNHPELIFCVPRKGRSLCFTISTLTCRPLSVGVSWGFVYK
mgnify:CR=1 FL=1|jgi:hypothetical protein